MIVAWHRFALIVACSLYVLGFIEVERYFGWRAACAALVGSLVLAVLLAQDFDSAATTPRRGPSRHRPWRRTGPYEGE